MKDTVGKVEAGKWVGNTEQAAKGLKKPIEGKAEKVLWDAKAALKEAAQKP